MHRQARAEPRTLRNWLPEGKRGAVCFTIDDVHPGRSADHYDGGGDLRAGALGRVERLLERHPQLHVTLFTTADWREISPAPSRRVLRRIPYLRDRVYLAPILRLGARSLDRHPEFVRYLRELPRTEVALHGLHHVHPGELIHVEFQNESVAACERALRAAMGIFDRAGLPYARGLCPPGWNAPPNLVTAMERIGFAFLASSRDIRSAVADEAKAAMSGLTGTSLLHPTLLGSLIHFTSNFQATSPLERAVEIVERGGVLAVKAHIVKNALGHVALDGIDPLYCNYLDLLFAELDRRYGESLWWTTMGRMAERAQAVRGDA